MTSGRVRRVGRASVVGVLLLTLASASEAAPAAHPPFAPRRDVSVAYRLESPDAASPGGSSAETLTFHATAGGRRLRLDTSGSGSYLLIDTGKKSATLVDPALKAFMTVPLDPKLARGLLLLDPEASYSRAGTAKVAGLACTLWKVGPQGTDGSVCVTADGVMLQRISGPSAVRQSRLTAVSVTFGSQPPALFAAPEGYQNLSAGRAPAVPVPPVTLPPVPPFPPLPALPPGTSAPRVSMPGGVPPAAVPPGPMPPGSMPPGSMPPGSMPPGSMPPGITMPTNPTAPPPAVGSR